MRRTFAIHKPKGEHSERGPSTAHRWRPCPGSVAKVRGLKDTAGIDAAYGTVFHEVAAICLDHDLDPFGFIGMKQLVEPHGLIEFDHEMAHHMIAGLDVLKSLEGPTGMMVVEQIVSLHEWVGEGEFGTADCVIIDPPNNRVVVWDWKYGAGVPVHPEMNDQAILYALGAWSSFVREIFFDYHTEQAAAAGGVFTGDEPWEDDIDVQVMIEQPRAPGGGGSWQTTMGTLIREGERIRIDARRTEAPDAPLVPGEKQCKFCPAARDNTCEARSKWLLDMSGLDFDRLHEDFVDGEEPILRRALTPEARSQVLLHKSLIEGYLDQLHKEAYHDAEQGRPVPGMKLVLGRRGARAWKDALKAEAVMRRQFGDRAYTPRTLLTPPALESEVGKKTYESLVAPWVVQGEPKPVLVAEDQPGEPIKNVLSYFDDLDDSETLV